MASDDEDEKFAHFLESEVFSELSDQENLDTEEEEEECTKVKRDGKRLCIEEGELSEQEEKEKQEAKKTKIDEGEIRDEGYLVPVRSSSSSSSSLSSIEQEAEVVATFSPSKENDIVMFNNGNNGRLRTEGREFPRRIGTGIVSQIPPELFFHILKFLSSADLVSCSLVCRFLNFAAAADESLWRRLYCMRWGILPPKRLRECAWKKLYIQRDKEDMIKFV